MLLLPPLLAACAGAAVVLGLRLAVLPLLDPKSWLWRSLLLGGTAVLAWRYMLWRFTATLAPLGWTVDAVCSWGFAILEGLTVVSSTLAFLILTRTKERTGEVEAHRGWWRPARPPRVDLFIATYNEELEVLERTIVGAKATTYPHTRVFVLDDKRRPWLRDACARHGVGYLTRPDNAHAKAGNINHALRVRAEAADRPDFVAVLDADFVPHTDFVERTLALFHDPTVGLVQTPQHFFNPDPIQHNLGSPSLPGRAAALLRQRRACPRRLGHRGLLRHFLHGARVRGGSDRRPADRERDGGFPAVPAPRRERLADRLPQRGADRRGSRPKACRSTSSSVAVGASA
jgi:cellulose synthase (UDP-forming)